MSAVLPEVNDGAINDFKRHKDAIIQDALEQSMNHLHEISAHGSDAQDIIQSGFEYTCRMLLAAVTTAEPKLLDDQAQWTVTRLPNDRVSMTYLLNRLRRLQQSIQKFLSETNSNEITPYIDYLVERIQFHRDKRRAGSR